MFKTIPAGNEYTQESQLPSSEDTRESWLANICIWHQQVFFNISYCHPLGLPGGEYQGVDCKYVTPQIFWTVLKSFLDMYFSARLKKGQKQKISWWHYPFNWWIIVTKYWLKNKVAGVGQPLR